MKINRRGYETLISSDNKTLFLVAGTVSVFDISGEKAVELKRFNALKNPSHVAVSSDEQLIAYKNTSGHIAVHDLKTGALLIKSRCTSHEGEGLFFTRNNKQVFSSDWDGNVFILDIESGEFSVIRKLSRSPLIIPIENKFIASDYISGECVLFELSLEDGIAWNKLCAIPPYRANSRGAVVLGEKIFFWAEPLQGNVQDLAAYAFASDILSFNIATRELSACVLLDELLKLYPKYHGVVFSSMCISKDEKTLLLGTDTEIIGIDLAEKKLLGVREAMYLSDLRFMASDTRVVIGTWRNLEIVDFEMLFQA